jgi:ParB-like chromosome segregation protein Spo0J
VICVKKATSVTKALNAIAKLGDLEGDELIEALNDVREALHRISPFKNEPVDYIRWVKTDSIQANDYNPNSVAPPEMQLLRLSILEDGYTQPIVTNLEEGVRVVIDGFHRNRVGRECDDIRQRVHGYLPIVQIRASQADKENRMASTIRHNRARGKHQVEVGSLTILALLNGASRCEALSWATSYRLVRL